jgi:hypothetical protein
MDLKISDHLHLENGKFLLKVFLENWAQRYGHFCMEGINHYFT